MLIVALCVGVILDFESDTVSVLLSVRSRVMECVELMETLRDFRGGDMECVTDFDALEVLVIAIAPVIQQI